MGVCSNYHGYFFSAGSLEFYDFSKFSRFTGRVAILFLSGDFFPGYLFSGTFFPKIFFQDSNIYNPLWIFLYDFLISWSQKRQLFWKSYKISSKNSQSELQKKMYKVHSNQNESWRRLFISQTTVKNAWYSRLQNGYKFSMKNLIIELSVLWSTLKNISVSMRIQHKYFIFFYKQFTCTYDKMK